MTAGRDLVGDVPSAPRGRGRPKGSRNKRGADLRSYLDATCGGTAALQLARECMVTVAEVKRAGTAEAAVLAKARRTVEAFDRERERLGQGLRDLVRAEVAAAIEAERMGADLAKRLDAMADRLEVGHSMTLKQALDRIDENRRALLPYTDQKQPMIVAAPPGQAPVMVLVGGSPEAMASEQNQQVIDGQFVDVTPRSHTPGQ